MAKTTITKGSVVEVSTNEPGFHGAWYAATVINEVRPSPTKNRSSHKKNKTLNKIGYLVTYHTLLKEDGGSEPLTEVVDPSFVRPSPPPNIRRNDGDNVKEAEEGDGDGDGDDGGGGDFEVCDVVDAYHRDGWWVGVVKRVIVEGELKKYLVAFDDPPEEVVFERCKIRLHVDWIDRRWMIPPKKKTPKKQSGYRCATDDARSGFSTASKDARVIDVDNETAGSSCSAKTNGRSRGKRFQSSAGSKGKTKVNASVMETRGSEDIHQDSTPDEQAIIVTPVRVPEDSKSHQKRKRGRPPELVFKTPIGLREDGNGIATDIDEQPLSAWYHGMHPLRVLTRSSCFSPLNRHGNSPSQAIVTHGRTTTTTITTSTDYQHNWPFIKRSPIWATIESLGLYLTPPQKPHFSPLKKMKEDYREGLAIARMVTFGNLVQRLSDLQPNDPVEVMNDSLETLHELETHGFDVGSIRGRLNELLSLKSKVCQHEDRRKEVEKELEYCNHEKSLVEKEIDRLKAGMQELKEKIAQAATLQKVKEKEVTRLQSNLQLVSNQINDLEVAFEKLAASPL